MRIFNLLIVTAAPVCFFLNFRHADSLCWQIFAIENIVLYGKYVIILPFVISHIVGSSNSFPPPSFSATMVTTISYRSAISLSTPKDDEMEPQFAYDITKLDYEDDYH